LKLVVDESPPGSSPYNPSVRTIATPFEWTFTRRDLNALLDRLDRRGRLAPAA